MKTIEDLREHLFGTLAGLRDKTVSIEEARATASIAQTIVDSARVEADVMKVTKHRGSGFIPEKQLPPGTPRLVSPMGER